MEKHPNEINLKEIIQRLQVKNVAGQYFAIEKTPEAYALFVNNMKENRWAFRHMSVTSDAERFIIFLHKILAKLKIIYNNNIKPIKLMKTSKNYENQVTF